MKKIKIILLSAMLGLLLFACESSVEKVVISSNPTAPALAELSFTGNFDITNLDGAIIFSWNTSDFGFASSTTYTLEISSTDDFTDNVLTLFTTQKLTGSTTVTDINAALLVWGKELGETATVYYRVSASVSPTNVLYSTIKSKDFVPFEVLIDYPMAYVPGAYQGWSPGDENGRLFSYGFNSLYQGIIRVVDGSNATVEFKVTVNPNWDGPNYGGTLTQTGNNYSGTLDASGGNLAVNAGTYKFDVDISALTINLTKTDDWGVIGSATANGWDADQDMFYNGQRKMWEITTNFTAGEFKFRANDGWTLNYGDNDTDGSLEEGGANIPIAEAGNYTVRLDTENLTYTVQKN